MADEKFSCPLGSAIANFVFVLEAGSRGSGGGGGEARKRIASEEGRKGREGPLEGWKKKGSKNVASEGERGAHREKGRRARDRRREG